jgi:hypothetical protein
MAQNTSIDVAANTWTLLTNSDVTTITFQNVGGHNLFIKATTDTSAPTTTNGGVVYTPGTGERNVAMTDLFPGLSGADRIWAYGTEGGRVMVSHA